jgi:Flp pilus assembly protein TadG
MISRIRRDEDGTAVIEMAVAAPLLIAIAAGAMAFGQIVLDYATADKSVRDTARFLSRLPAGGVCNSTLFDQARYLAMYGQETVGTTPLIQGWTDKTTITLLSPDCSSTPTDPFSIKVQAAIPYTNNILKAIGIGTSFTMTVTHEEPHIGH